MTTATREELAHMIDDAEWDWLRTHLERGGLVLVDGSLDLADAALKIARDDASAVGEWIANGMIGKPTAEQIAAWDGDRTKTFSMLVVSPYVLIQELCAV